ncbi:MAG: putative O-glycosylation ligase, exosortase A system-associated [Colwellia sp.]|nr:putative O-glycosylation ligase, exosortase A system-associated [Colwellia sp.]MCW8866497.1 putative O-glycosylation ligase, exosortase A system-associated [Colwellia sp.]MCW9080686.1 putative O-glycosylation ligase, exosortase A system-associated [Colwellia sp.]
MRDVLVLIFILAAAYYSFKKPYLGVCAWIWVALLAPANWAFGFSQSFRINLTIVLITVASYLFVQKDKGGVFGKQGGYILMFWILALISTIFHQTVDVDEVLFEFEKFTKVIALYLFVGLTIKKRVHIDTFIWAIVLGLSSYAAMEGVKFILSLGGHRIIGMSGVIEDRNDLAVAINMCIPLIIYLWSVTKHQHLKLALLGLTFLNIVSVIGTYSRGGFIGLTILAIAMWFKSKRKFSLALVALIMIPLLYVNAPDTWKERQTTITTASSQDGSFIGRLWAWKISTLIALDNPVTGGGFKSVTDPVQWNIYAPITPNFGPIDTPTIPTNLKPKAAHNIYFQVLGDHGFTGLVLFLLILSSTYFQCQKNIKQAKRNGVDWCANLSSAISLSLIGYCITGLNVSLAYFELVYALVGIVGIVRVYLAKLESSEINS